MKWVVVTCLSLVHPAGSIASLLPYLAETSFHVPISLFSSFASGSRAAARADAKTTAATRANPTVTVIRRIQTSLLRTVRNPTPNTARAAQLAIAVTLLKNLLLALFIVAKFAATFRQ